MSLAPDITRKLRAPVQKQASDRPPKPHNLDDDIKRVQKSWAKRWGQG
jgi:hypothetical protein